MIVLVDTNVVLDILLERKDFVEYSSKAIKKALRNNDSLFISSSSITDIYYIVRKACDSLFALECLLKATDIFNYAEVNQYCIYQAICSKISDFEDAVVDSVAENVNANFILTRNIAHFTNSKVQAITPKDFLEI